MQKVMQRAAILSICYGKPYVRRLYIYIDAAEAKLVSVGLAPKTMAVEIQC